MVKLRLKDGKVMEIDSNLTVLDAVKNLSVSLAKKTIGAKFNGNLINLNTVLNADGDIEFITIDSPEAEVILNHSTAHLLANAIKNIQPGTMFGVGPTIEEGFYYDFLAPSNFVEDDLEKIEKEMAKIASQSVAIVRKEISKKEALELFKNDKYKIELIEALEGQISIYQQGDFVDLCRGPHLPNTNQIKHFKLLNLAGSYWRGDSKNDSLQRIYGIAFFSKEKLEEYLRILEDRKARDHRKIGKELKLFAFNPLTGQGLPLWLPNGMIIRQEIQDYILKLERKYKYLHVATPILGNIELYKTSGHWEHYREDMFTPVELDNETLVLRPMSCPHHVLIYRTELRSYRDLPIRYAEQVLQHRYEASGALTGMERVRAMNLTDSHVFCRPEQIKSEFAHALRLILRVLEDLNIEISYYRLSLHDSSNKEKYFNDEEMWLHSENMLREVLRECNVEFIEAVGEAAFYGPKLDIQIKTALGHDITLSTIQLDFLLPERFDLSYIDEQGEKSRPVMIHRGLIGTYERFLAILIEQYKGVFPVWLAPVQVAILPVAEAHNEYGNQVVQFLEDNDIRVSLDTRNEKLSYRLREAQVQKVPYTLVLGNNEQESSSVTYRQFGKQEQTTVSLEQFLELIKKDINNKSRKVLRE